MTQPSTLDPDLLRAFVLIAEGSNFTEAAGLLGRTQSAVSMQIKRLEDALGQPVLHRGQGSGIDLTPHGAFLLARARQILALNDEVVATFRAPQIAGTVRLGTPDDYAFGYLPPVLKRFADTHPAVQVDVLCEPSSGLVERLKRGELDLALLSDGTEPRGLVGIALWRGRLVWVTSTRHAPHRLDPLPLALASPDPLAERRGCDWGRAAIHALEHAGRRFRIAYTSGSQVGTHAPVLAGLAVTVSAQAWLPEGLRPTRPEEGLPGLPDYGIVLVKGRGARQPVADALASHIEESCRLDAPQGRAA
ncbi:MAG: LysR substrate-binding domain-containing protein [Acetobacteraceae bacterium]